ncbi:hypothetical protein ACIQNI_24480 [Streptomyces sp. NPDC091266]|uniref:hypothetical protein n=1 Tax=Streptomyces sp. NPDC091266 TaxID=3365978 RepID=UPI003825780C
MVQQCLYVRRWQLSALPLIFPESAVSSFCPDCGSSSPPEARFCMGCGRERQAAAPPAPAAPTGPPPAPLGAPQVPAAPPGYVPYAAPARPSPVGAFLTRTAKGDWVAALKIAGWPTLLLLVLAALLGIISSDDTDSAGIGWGVRMRSMLAVLLQSVGGGVTLSGNATGSLGSLGDGMTGEASLSLVPLVVTALWVAVLVYAARRAGRATTVPGTDGALPPAVRGAVPETVLRVALLCGAGSLALGLLAQPSYDGVEVSSAPWLALLWSFLLAAVVTGAVLARTEAGAWLAARPAWHAALRALRTALFALLIVITLAGVATFVTVLATADDLKGGQVVALLVLLPNIGAMALAMAWGAPLNAEWNLPDMPFLESGRRSIGYSELADGVGGWGLAGIIVGGLLCALLVGLLAVRRGADRREQLLAAGFFVVAMVLLVALAGASVSATFHGDSSGSGSGSDYGSDYGSDQGSGGGAGGIGGMGGLGDTGGLGGSGGASGPSVGAHAELAAGFAETLLFVLLWTCGAVLLAPYLLRAAGRGGPSAPAAPAAPYGAYAAAPGGYGYPAAAGTPAPPTAPADATPTPPLPTPTAHDLPSVPPADGNPGQVPGPGQVLDPGQGQGRSGAVKWVAMALAAFLIGGGATAGVLYVKNQKDDGDSKAGKPAAVGSKKPADAHSASAAPTPTPTPSVVPTKDAASPAADGLPAGFVLKHDSGGFSLGVKSDWQRSQKGTQTDYKAPTGVSYLRIGVIAGAPQSSYDNFRTLEKGAEKRTGYRRVELTQNTFRGHDGARWEFRYVNDDSGDTIHAIDQAYVADDGTEYSIYYECLEPDYDPATDQVFPTALNSWSVGSDG